LHKKERKTVMRFSDGDQYNLCNQEAYHGAINYDNHVALHPETMEENYVLPDDNAFTETQPVPEAIPSEILAQPKLFIPQGLKDDTGDVVGENSCPLDSVLQFFHVLTQAGVFINPLAGLRNPHSLLHRTFTKLSAGHPDQARQMFIDEFIDPPDLTRYSDVYRYFVNQPISDSCQLKYESFCSNNGCPSGRTEHTITCLDTDSIVSSIERDRHGEPRPDGWEQNIAFLLDYEFTKDRALDRSNKRRTVCSRCSKGVMMRTATKFKENSHLICMEYSNRRHTRSISEQPLTLGIAGKQLVQRGSINCNSRHWTALLRMPQYLLLFDGCNPRQAHERYGWTEGEAAMVGGYRHSFVVYEILNGDDTRIFGQPSFDINTLLTVEDAWSAKSWKQRRGKRKVPSNKGNYLFPHQKNDCPPTSYQNPILIDLDESNMNKCCGADGDGNGELFQHTEQLQHFVYYNTTSSNYFFTGF
jgi:hypothetical protein